MSQSIETAIQKIASLEAPTYSNTTKVFSLAGVEGTLWDLTKVALGARLNLGLYGGAGMGKSQLLADVQSLVGNNASYVLGRNDLIRSGKHSQRIAKLSCLKAFLFLPYLFYDCSV